jgi:hypothetical protein
MDHPILELTSLKSDLEKFPSKQRKAAISFQIMHIPDVPDSCTRCSEAEVFVDTWTTLSKPD